MIELYWLGELIVYQWQTDPLSVIEAVILTFALLAGFVFAVNHIMYGGHDVDK